MKASYLFFTLLVFSGKHALGNTHHQQDQKQWKNSLYKSAKNIAAAYATHVTLQAIHHAGHVLAAQLALLNGSTPLQSNYKFAFKPLQYGLYATSTVPIFTAGNTNAAVEFAGPALGIIAACCLIKLWDCYQKDETEKNLKERILADFRKSESDTLPLIPLIALTHLAFNAGVLLPINHKPFEGYHIAKSLGWIE